MAATVLLFGARAEAANRVHVRVILDPSGSMVHTDPSGLARLSTVLLYDLVHPNLTTGDTFQVLPFDAHEAAWNSGPPPPAGGHWIIPSPGRREEFARAIHRLAYNAEHTYYYPVLEAAISDLERTPAQDRRVIVFVTDGQPEDPDVRLIAQYLIPRMERSGIQLNVVAFGNEAESHRESIETALGGAAAGDFLIDADGTRLLDDMVTIFSRSFGYSASTARAVQASGDLDLEDRQAPDRAAVVVYWKRPTAPSFTLRPPGGGAINNPEGVATSTENGGSYSMMWALSPNRGLHQLRSEAGDAMVVVLRPSAYVVEVEAGSGSTSHETMADTRLPLTVIVTPTAGVRDFQGSITLAFRTNGPRTEQGYEWSGTWMGAEGHGTPTGRGKRFEISPTFESNRKDPSVPYQAFVTIEVRRGEVPVGSLSGDHAHEVLVFPFLHMTPSPAEDYALRDGSPTLRSPDLGCTTFNLDVSGQLPTANQGKYAVRAVLDPDLAQQPQLDRAQFRLDREVLEFEGSQARRYGQWFAGNPLTAEQLRGPHTVCIGVGRPKDVNPEVPLTLLVHFILVTPPYDRAGVIDPFALKARLAAPGLLERFGTLATVVLGAVLAAVAVWYLRYRITVPQGLFFPWRERGLTPYLSLLDLGRC